VREEPSPTVHRGMKPIGKEIRGESRVWPVDM
jgi:hypothetical protein